jgi:hypothetical protein
MRANNPGSGRAWGHRGLIVAMAIGLGLTTLACGSDRAPQTERSSTGQGWVDTKEFAMRDRVINGTAATIWTGHEVILVGALLSADQRQIMESPAYDPATDSWRTIAPPPVVFVRDVYPAHALWTGTEVLFFGSGAPLPNAPQTEGSPPAPIVGAAYNPTTDSWRTLAPPPAEYYRLTAAVWTGDRLLAWTQGVGVTAFDPSTNEWAAVPAQPAPAGTNDPIGPTGPGFSTGDAPALWDGTRLIVFGGYSGDVAAFDPTAGKWAALPRVDSGVTAAVWTGRQLLVFDSDGGTIAVFDAKQNVWNDGAAPPFSSRAMPGTTAWTGSAFAAWAGLQFDYSPTSAVPGPATDGATYDISTNAWTSMPPLPAPEITYVGGVATSNTLFTWGTGGTSSPNAVIRAVHRRP